MSVMQFKDRVHAGRLLAKKLKKLYSSGDVTIYALPRGGVVTAKEIAKVLKAPLDLIITRKIGHPESPEYAIAAVSESGLLVANNKELMGISSEWIKEEIQRQKSEIVRRRKIYLGNRERLSPEGRTAILVDDGVATGFTLLAGIRELRRQKAKRIVIAVPVLPESAADAIRKKVDELVAIIISPDESFLGAVGSYYNRFDQVEDDEVIDIIESYVP